MSCDYKTGKENRKKYSHQVHEYAKELKNMEYNITHKFLVYTEHKTVEEI